MLMALPVDVQSLDVLRTIRGHLCTFGEDARNALAATDMEINRMVTWLTQDRRLYWDAQIRQRRVELELAKSEMSRKRTSQMFGSEANMGEQRDNLRKAKLRLEEAEEKLERVKKWIAPLQQAVLEYRGRARPMSDLADAHIEKSLGMLDRMIAALEEYSTTSPSSTEYVRAMKEERLMASRAEAAQAPAEPEAQPTAPEPKPSDDAEAEPRPQTPSPEGA
jgi:hypothetical protein